MSLQRFAVLGIALLFATQSFGEAAPAKHSNVAVATSSRCARYADSVDETVKTCERFKKNASEQVFVAECENGVAKVKALMAKANCQLQTGMLAH